MKAGLPVLTLLAFTAWKALHGGADASGTLLEVVRVWAGLFAYLTLHEASHLVVGTGLGLPADSVRIGDGPALASFRVGAVRWTLRAIPESGAVGFVFMSSRRWKNVLTVLAGPLMPVVAAALAAPGMGADFLTLCLAGGVYNLLPMKGLDGWTLINQVRAARAARRAPA